MIHTLNKISKWFLGFLAFNFSIIYLLFILTDNFQLTSSSFDKIKRVNNELMKLEELVGNQYEKGDELIFDAYNYIDPNILGFPFTLEEYIKDYYRETVYKADIESIKNSLSDKVNLKEIEKREYLVKDSLEKAILRIVNNKKFKLESYHIDSYVKSFYYIPRLEYLVLPDSLLQKLVNLKDISFKSEEMFEQEAKRQIGIWAYNNYSPILRNALKKYPSWYWSYLEGFLVLLIIFIIGKVLISVQLKKEKEKETVKQLDINIKNAEEQIKQHPEKILPVWDIANLTLQKYYNKNLEQVNSIYKLSVIVMILGFLLIVSILIVSIFFELNSSLDEIGIIAGIITEFIGATFLFIYKSTVNQALQHSKSLEKINNVGMSIKIIESIESNEQNQVKIDEAKIEIGKKLLTTHNSGSTKSGV